MSFTEKMELRVAEIYPTFNGEQNRFGIGSPTIFVRLAGCHLRCYKTTLGSLCDTPKFLDNLSGENMTLEKLFEDVMEVSRATGIKLICLSGGDPLARPTEQVVGLLSKLLDYFSVTVETSGTISIKEIIKNPTIRTSHISGKLSFILDHKLSSAGIKVKDTVIKDLGILRQFDYIKFVVYGEEDYLQTKAFIEENKLKTFANLVVGCYWGGEMTPFQLFDRLKEDVLLGFVQMNFQVHKMALASDYSIETNSKQI